MMMMMMMLVVVVVVMMMVTIGCNVSSKSYQSSLAFAGELGHVSSRELGRRIDQNDHDKHQHRHLHL